MEAIFIQTRLDVSRGAVLGRFRELTFTYTDHEQNRKVAISLQLFQGHY